MLSTFFVYILFTCLSTSLGISTHLDSQAYHAHNLTVADRKLSALGSESSYHDTPHHAHQDYLRNLEGLLQRSPSVQHPYTMEDPKPAESHDLPSIHLYRIAPFHEQFYQNHEADYNPLKKHDFGGGGWDSFQPGGQGGFGGDTFQHGGQGGLGQLGQAALKKGKEAKALFILMAPLILLAVFGPILASQAMLPWVANGGLTSVTTMAGGKRRRRRQVSPELEKRLQLFLEVQDFITRTGSHDLVEKMGEAFLQCQMRSKCVERMSCEYTDNASKRDPEEMRIGRMVLRNVMSNPMVPFALINRLQKGMLFANNHPGRCSSYWCEAVDRPKREVKRSRNRGVRPHLSSDRRTISRVTSRI